MTARFLVVVVTALGLLVPGGTALAATIIDSVAETNGEPEGVHITGDTFTHADGNVPSPYTVPVFGEDVVAFTDRDHQYNGAHVGLPSFLVGGDYVMTANDARDNGNYTLDVTLAQPAHLYVIRDNRRATTLPAWFTDGAGLDFSDTGADVGYDEDGVANGTTGPGVGINQTGSVYIGTDTATGSTLLAANTHYLFQSETPGNNMYGVVASLEGPGHPDPNAPFDIVMDIGPEGQRVQSGHIGVPDPTHASTPNNGNNGPEVSGIPVDTGTGTFYVSISDTNQAGGDDGRIDWRDRGNSSNGGADLVMLAEDFIKNNGGIIRLTLEGLPAGTYDATSYHVDPSFTQSEAIGVFVDVGAGFVDMLVEGDASHNNGGVNGLTTADILDSAASFRFVADGLNPVHIVFDGNLASDTEVPLSGLRLQFTPNVIPEPTALLIWSLLGALCATLGWRRRKG